MESITIGRCFRGAWKDAGSAFSYRPLFVFVIFALMVAVSYVPDALTLLTSSPVAKAIATYGDGAIYVAAAILGVIQLCALAGLSMQVERDTLLGADAGRSVAFFDKRFWKFIGVCLLLWILFVVGIGAFTNILVAVLSIVDSSSHGFLLGHAADLIWSAAMAALSAIALFVLIRLSLLPCPSPLEGERCGARHGTIPKVTSGRSQRFI